MIMIFHEISEKFFSASNIDLWNKFSMRICKPTGHNSLLNFINISWEIYEKMSAENFDFSYNCDFL